MTEFDELKLIECVRELMRERGQECTVNEIRRIAKATAKQLDMSLEAALEAMEEDLLSSPPGNE